MLNLNRLLLVVVALLLGACAGPITSECAKNSICPVVIYEKFPGYFATYPDHLEVKTGGGAQSSQTVLWTFADASKYKFQASTDNIKGDGVELIDANGSTIGLTSCFVTRNSRPDFKPAAQGAYYRCEIVSQKDFKATRYLIRFRTIDGSPRMVDPTVSSTGSADPRVDPEPVSVPAVAGDPVILPPMTPDIGGIQVVWDSEAGAVFGRANTPMVFKDQATTKEVDIQPCTPSTTPDGKTAASEGRYYTCIFTTTLKPLGFTYEAKYRDSSSATKTRTGTVTRPN